MTADYQAARARYYALVTSRLDDIRAANTAAAAARIKGTKSTAPTEAKIDANIATAKDEMDVLAEATDATGDELMKAVADCREEWIAILDAADDEATQRLAELTKAAEKASHDLDVARSAASWLREYHQSHSQTQYPGANGHSASTFAALKKLINGETRLVGYRDGGPIWETVKS